MKKIISILLFINFYSIGYSQVVKGLILDKYDNSPIYNANVYFNGTFVGTLSDEDGKFQLEILDNTSMPITISSLGYHSVTTTNYSIDKSLLIYLTPKLFDLGEFEITGSLNYFKERQKNLKLFKREFFGNTPNAKHCEIMNEEDISFSFIEDRKILKAFSSKAILIDNKALGYQISYFLDKFEYKITSNFLLLTGNYLFKEAFASDEIKVQKFEKIRKITYLGSRMHFFRALWENKDDLQDFIISNPKYPNLTYEQLVIETFDKSQDSTVKKYIKSERILNVIYYPKRWQDINILNITKDVYFDKRGYFDPMSIVWEGAMANQRIADLLPYEYKAK